MNKITQALHISEQGGACSQAILAVFAKDFGLDEKMAFKLATGLGAGFGRKQYACGAISAGVIVLSLKYGSESPEEDVKKDETYSHVFQFIDKMEKQLGNINCIDLLDCDLSTEEGRIKCSEFGLTQKICPNCIKIVAEYLEKTI